MAGEASLELNRRGAVVAVVRERGGTSFRSLARKRGACDAWTSEEVTHPSTTLAQARLGAEFSWDLVH